MSLKTLIGATVDNAASDENILNKAYDDIIHTSAQNLGQAAGTLTSTLNILLAPISWAVYGFEFIDSIVKSKLKEKLANTPIEDLKQPESNIVIPAYEALRYSLNKEQLKNMYINLIANSMKISTSEHVHPAFVEVIKQFSTFDADLLYWLFIDPNRKIPKIKIRLQLSEYDTTGTDAYSIILSPLYYPISSINQYTLSLENLERLKIIEIRDYIKLVDDDAYNHILKFVSIDSLKSTDPHLPYVNIIKGSIVLTNFGKELVKNIF